MIAVSGPLISSAAGELIVIGEVKALADVSVFDPDRVGVHPFTVPGHGIGIDDFDNVHVRTVRLEPMDGPLYDVVGACVDVFERSMPEGAIAGGRLLVVVGGPFRAEVLRRAGVPPFECAGGRIIARCKVEDYLILLATRRLSIIL